MPRKTKLLQKHCMTESYGVSAKAYLARAEARLASGRCEEFFYAALELRAGVESRMQEYLEAHRHISKKKKKGWQIAKLGRSIEQAFRLGDKVAEITVIEVESKSRIALLYYTPVKDTLNKKAGRLGDYLHAISFQKVSNDKWWLTFRTLLEQTVDELSEATEGVLLGPPMMRSTKEIYMSVSGFSEQEMKHLLKKMRPKQEVTFKVKYLPRVPKGAQSRVFAP